MLKCTNLINSFKILNNSNFFFLVFCVWVIYIYIEYLMCSNCKRKLHYIYQRSPIFFGCHLMMMCGLSIYPFGTLLLLLVFISDFHTPHPLIPGGYHSPTPPPTPKHLESFNTGGTRPVLLKHTRPPPPHPKNLEGFHTG